MDEKLERWRAKSGDWDGVIPLPAARSCPFCGGEPEGCTTNPDAWWVRCADCGADAESAKTKSIALRRWNRRTS